MGCFCMAGAEGCCELFYILETLSFRTQKLHKQLWCAIFPLGKISERKAFAEKKTKNILLF